MKTFFAVTGARLRSLFGRSKLDAGMEEEMRAHLELQTERNVAEGLSPEEARYAAQRSFGGVEQIKERARAQRGWLWLEQAVQDLRFGARTLAKSPAFAGVAVVSLALGIGLNTAVFSLINTLFYQTIRGVPEPQRVLFFNAGTSPEGFRYLRESTADVMAINAGWRLEAAVHVREFERQIRLGAVSANYFAVLRQSPVAGRFFSGSRDAAQEPHEPEIVIEHGFWQRELGGDRGILGEVVRINRVPFTVVGVVRGTGIDPPAFQIPLGAVPLVLDESKPGGGSSVRRLGLLGRLQPGVSLVQAQAALDVVSAREPELFPETRFRLSAGREDWRGAVSQEKRTEKLLVTVVPLVVVALLLWIACSNVSNLLLARAVQRQKEIAIRVASGASRGRLVRMLMAESLILSFLGGAAGLWVSGRTLDFVFATLANFGGLAVELDEHVLLYTAGVCLFSTVLFGLVPALRASRLDINHALKGEASCAGFRPARLRRWFLTSQIASSVALLIVAGTFAKTLVTQFYAGEHAKIAPQLLIAQLAVDDVPALERAEFHRSTAGKLRAVPGVVAVTLVEGAQRSPLRLTAPNAPAPATKSIEVSHQLIDTEYFKTVSIRLAAGALPADAGSGSGGQEALVNESALRLLWPAEDPLGRVIVFEGGQSFRVAGVVHDSRDGPAFYSRLPREASGPLQALVRTRGPAEKMKPAITAALRDPARPRALPHVGTYREVVFRGMSEITRLATFVGVLALALAASGICASMAFSSSQRTREIGVRMALGATRRNVFALMLREVAGIVGWGSAIGVVAGIAGLGVLARMMFGRWVTDPVALLGVVLFFAVVALLASLLPIRRATKVDPMVALRSE